MRAAAGLVLLVAALLHLLLTVGAFAVVFTADDARSTVVSTVGNLDVELEPPGEPPRRRTLTQILASARATSILVGAIAAVLALAQIGAAIQSFRGKWGVFVAAVGVLSLVPSVLALAVGVGFGPLFVPGVLGGGLAIAAGVFIHKNPLHPPAVG